MATPGDSGGERSKAALLIDLVTKGVPIKTAYGAAGMTTSEYKLWASIGDNQEQLEIARKKAEARLVQKMIQLGSTDWKCLQSLLERINPAEYAKPEVQAQLAQSDNDAKSIGLAIMKFLALGEGRHSGHNEVVKNAVVIAGDVVPDDDGKSLTYSDEDGHYDE